MARLRRKARRQETIGSFLRFLLFLGIAALLLRSLLVAPFSIPSESMLPRLLIGDYLLVAKSPYGWSRYSFPFAMMPIAGRIGGMRPARGDVIVFKTPADNRTDYVKRVIGLPGDRVQLHAGHVILNGIAIPRVRIADFRDPASPNSPCRPIADVTLERARDGTAACRYPRFRETLPGGRSYEVLDIGHTDADETGVFTVPADHYFLMGDNRDRSADSRFPAKPDEGIGMVPAENIVGRAWIVFFSTDGSAAWLKPWTWFSAARWARIGAGF